MAFRSIVVSLTAATTTILSAFIGFGVLTLVVQEGHLLGLTGLNRTGPIETFVPPIAFAIRSRPSRRRRQPGRSTLLSISAASCEPEVAGSIPTGKNC